MLVGVTFCFCSSDNPLYQFVSCNLAKAESSPLATKSFITSVCSFTDNGVLLFNENCTCLLCETWFSATIGFPPNKSLTTPSVNILNCVSGESFLIPNTSPTFAKKSLIQSCNCFNLPLGLFTSFSPKLPIWVFNASPHNCSSVRFA